MAEFFDVIILGAGASGLMCALEASKRGRRVLVLDHAQQIGNKIRIAGGGRCNFTNRNVQPHHYLSQNPSFCQSALQRYTPRDFIKFVETAQIPYEERNHGQLFGSVAARALVEALVQECQNHSVFFRLEASVQAFEIEGPQRFSIELKDTQYQCHSFVVATGGLSFEGLGASGIGHFIAQQAQIPVVPTQPGLVPLLWNSHDARQFAPLAGIAISATVQCQKHRFTENVLFTHRGLSGPAILQISSYWQPHSPIQINWLPGIDLFAQLKGLRNTQKSRQLNTVLQEWLPKRMIAALTHSIASVRMADCSDKTLKECTRLIQEHVIYPQGTEGYAKAEVTRGGVDTRAISSKTMEALDIPGLFFVGEVLDVTGWLGGYNLQWAWSSGWCAGQYV